MKTPRDSTIPLIRLAGQHLHAFEQALGRLEADMARPAKKASGPPPTKAEVRATRAKLAQLEQRYEQVQKDRQAFKSWRAKHS